MSTKEEGQSRDFLGFGPGRRSRARYFSTAWAVVTQLCPSFAPWMSPRRTRSRRWLTDSPLSSAASCRVISSFRFGRSEPLSLALCDIQSKREDIEVSSALVILSIVFRDTLRRPCSTSDMYARFSLARSATSCCVRSSSRRRSRIR